MKAFINILKRSVLLASAALMLFRFPADAADRRLGDWHVDGPIRLDKGLDVPFHDDEALYGRYQVSPSAPSPRCVPMTGPK